MSRNRRILIITSGHLCRNPRPYKEAVALGEAGFSVRVLSPDSSSAFAALDRELVASQPFTHQTLPVRRSLPLRVRRWLACRVPSVGLNSIHALGDAGPLLEVAQRDSADLIIVHNEIPHWIGARLIATGRRVAADIEDWHSEDLLPTDRARRPLRLLRSVERELLHRARFTTTTSNALAHALHARFGGRRPAVVTNSFPLQAEVKPRELRNPPSLFWFSQTLGPGRGLEEFLSAWQLTQQVSRLVLLGNPVAGFATHLFASLPEAFRSRVEICPLVPPADLPAVIASHDVGLALEDAHILSRDLTITNKLLQYLNAGLAVLATETKGQREVLERAPEAGMFLPSTPDAAAKARVIDTLIGDGTRLRQRQQAARALAEEHYCWEREAPRLVELVQRALA